MAYLDLVEPEPDKNRRNGLIIFVICVILLGTLVKCAGQPCTIRSKPYTDYPTVTRILACEGLTYEANEKEIFIGIYADSIKPYKYIPVLYVYLPKGLKIKNPDILITFENGAIPEMRAQVNDSTGNYIEFTCKDPYFYDIRNSKINMIHVINDGVGYYVYEDKMDLFYEFMRGL